MLKQIFGFPFYIKNISNHFYNKKNIIEDIEFNYKKDKNRNNLDSKESDLHHSFGDFENANFKKINFNEIIPIYESIFKDFFSLLPLKKPIKFKFKIVNYTCMTSNQFMKNHYHPDTDFTAIHYLKFNKNIHKPTLFENSHVFSEYLSFLRPNLQNLLNMNNIVNSLFSKNFYLDIEEDDICITPGLMFHSVPKQIETNETRITIVSNINIESL
jgi:hypothetical protein